MHIIIPSIALRFGCPKGLIDIQTARNLIDSKLNTFAVFRFDCLQACGAVILENWTLL
jgi:hypothetical protein